MSPVRVGFLGAGLIATYHSKVLHRSGEPVYWAGVFDPDPARAEAFGAASGAKVMRSEDEVLDTSDAVYICTWTSEHRRLVQAAAARGLPVFCEKPLSTSLEGARAMAEAVRDAGVVNMVGLVLRHSPAFGALRRLVSQPSYGRVMSVVFRDDQYIPVQGMYRSAWRGDVAKAGAGALLEHSIHDIDVLDWVVGPITSVNTRTARMHAIEGIEDVAAAAFTLDGGGAGTLISVWHDLIERPSLRRIEVICERAWFALEGDWFGPLRMTTEGEPERVIEMPELSAMAGNPRSADADFIRAVRDGSPAHPDFAVAVRAHEIADAMYRSAAMSGAPVDLF